MGVVYLAKIDLGGEIRFVLLIPISIDELRFLRFVIHYLRIRINDMLQEMTRRGELIFRASRITESQVINDQLLPIEVHTTIIREFLSDLNNGSLQFLVSEFFFVDHFMVIYAALTDRIRVILSCLVFILLSPITIELNSRPTNTTSLASNSSLLYTVRGIV